MLRVRRARPDEARLGAARRRTSRSSMVHERPQSERFVLPRFDRPVDLEAHLARLPPDATCKGMFFRDQLELASRTGSPESIAAAAGIPHRRYLPFLDYPMHDNLKLTVEVSRRVYPTVSLGEGLRRLGRIGFETFLTSHVGKVLVLAAGHDVGAVLMLAPRAFPLVMSFGKVTTTRVDDRTVIARCSELPAFVETYQVGTLEGIFAHFGIDGTVRVAMEDLANGAIEARW